MITDKDTYKQWRLTDFYGHADVKERDKGWDLFRHPHGNCTLPWLICGDFNEILYSSEKIGGILTDDYHMKGFQKVLTDYGLVNRGYSGSRFTWKRGNLPETNIREWFDRRVMNSECLTCFPHYVIEHLPHSFLDHCPLLVSTDNGRSK